MTERMKLTTTLSGCNVSGTGLGPYILNHLINTKILLLYHSHFTDKQTKEQRLN